MVSALSIICMFVTLLICFALPFIVASVFKKKGLSTWGVFFIGMLGFVILQIVIRIPLLQFISRMPWYQSMAESAVLTALFLGITAAVFETFGRFMVFKWMLKKRRSYGDGLMAGLGHGAIEAILITGITYINNLIYSFMINLNLKDMLLNSAPSASSAQASIEAGINGLISSPPYLFLYAGWERAMVIVIHIALSMLVLEGIRRKQTIRYCLFAVLFHGLLDTIGVILAINEINMIFIELLALVFMLASLFYIIVSKKRFHTIPEPELLNEK